MNSEDGSNPLKRLTKQGSSRSDKLHVSDIEQAYEAHKDAENMLRDRQRRERLQSYTGEDEITQNGHHTTVNVTLPQTASQPEVKVEASIEVGPVKVSGLPRWAIVAIAGVVAVGTAVAASLWAHR